MTRLQIAEAKLFDVVRQAEERLARAAELEQRLKKAAAIADGLEDRLDEAIAQLREDTGADRDG